MKNLMLVISFVVFLQACTTQRRWPGGESYDLEIKAAADVWVREQNGEKCDTKQEQQIAGRSVELSLRKYSDGCHLYAAYSPGFLSRTITQCYRKLDGGSWGCGAWPR